eukprot:CAMPEP_0196767176 /NCGR_PEP_ID=MMETSP1095-20130614/37046_1 /TAXON_ID=96789 ORGANISM="Chromulina nebulosa, Strain UTEXLB2642" /NCGR_SAMPLE_ID=MMETSP1095 /ASSEMBLY_ACC=CAM_ASM_000446 /LENGTH=126 /DNA_ID=CAMNT_0042133847 /DNA_START=354 /DNA_END=734 /DNA_ORIENTATION=-
MTGCRGCASGSGGQKNIFGNRYGQYLAAIQISREERQLLKEKQNDEEDEDDQSEEERDYSGPVGAADGSSGKKASVWANDENEVDIPEELLGRTTAESEQEARAAAKHLTKQIDSSGPPGKRRREG